MNSRLGFILALALSGTAGLRSADAAPQCPKSPCSVVHFVVVNMSGAARGLHHRGDVIPLPIAQRVALQVPAGDSIQITSETDSRLRDVITIAATDEGRTLAIH
jgi:hypothetical protein